MTAETKVPTQDDTILCEECGQRIHSVAIHLKKNPHGDMTVESYQAKHAGKPILSPYAQHLLDQETRRRAETVAAATPVGIKSTAEDEERAAFHELFGLGAVKGAMSREGKPIAVRVLKPEFPEMVPEIDPGYVFDITALKDSMLAIELNIPLYVWGHTGTGKTTLLEQICARTKRPALRVQHTANTEESHIIGAKSLKDGQVFFEFGPLALAMKHGWVYVADEYDFASPSVLSVYQPVLEGKPLVIKEAERENMVIQPHKNFRFLATGNTNGTGDETGLYQGTSLQNAANYDRFGMVIKKDYMPPEQEEQMLVNQARLAPEDAKRMIAFATDLRKAHDAGKISAPISPRTLIYASVIGVARGDMRLGIERSFLSKMSAVDHKACSEIAQRHLG